MHKLKYFLFVTFIFLPLAAGAHGGVSKTINHAVVFLNQTPLSPLIGEKVQFAFSLVDDHHQPLKNMAVTLGVTRAFYGDEAKDVQVWSQNLTTDVNGTLVFDYSFPTTDYYDIDLSFADPGSGEVNETGFLVQPRMNSVAVVWWKYFIAVIAGVFIGIMAKRAMIRK